MTRLADIEGHIASMAELRDIVAAMRSLAGMRVQEAQRALPGIRRYAQSMAEAIGAVMALVHPAPVAVRTIGQRAVVLFMAEHGFVGGFNERLIEAATPVVSKNDRLFVLGDRGAVLADERGLSPVWTRSIATRADGAPETVSALASELYRGIAQGEFTRVDIMYHRYRQGGTATIERQSLLPVDLAALPVGPPRQPPLHNLAPDDLLEKLLAEYVFALLAEAAVESISSENGARFAAMESAHDNVTRKLAELRQSARTVRQDDITAELLDLVTGAEAQKAGAIFSA